MSRRRQGILAGLLVACWVVGAPASLRAAPSTLTFPRPAGYVNDFTRAIDPSTRAALDERLARYDRTTGNQIAIAIFPDLGGVPINEFTVRLEEAWKVGRRGKDNGVLLLVALQERQVRIEVGYGLEGKVTDADAGGIIRQIIAPAFRAGRYGEGLEAASDALVRLIEGGTASAPGAPGQSTGAVPSVSSRAVRTRPGGLGLLPIILFLAFIGFSLAASRVGARRCPRCGTPLQPSAPRAGLLGGSTYRAWVCPRCGYREKQLAREGGGMVPFGPLWLGGGGWGTGGFSGAGGGFGGFGGGSSGGGGATGSW